MGNDAPSKAPSFMGVPMKHVSLITLTFQNSALILIMHYSRTMPSIGGHRYFTSTAVFLNDCHVRYIPDSTAFHAGDGTFRATIHVCVFWGWVEVSHSCDVVYTTELPSICGG